MSIAPKYDPSIVEEKWYSYWLEKKFFHSESVRKHENIIETEYLGIDKFADSSINYKIKIMCKPENKFFARRLVNNTIKKELDKNGISIPYPQLTVHKGE